MSSNNELKEVRDFICQMYLPTMLFRRLKLTLAA